MEKIPSFVRGNTTVIAVRPQWEDMDAQGGKTLTDADLTKVKDMVVTMVSMFGKRYEMAWKLVDSKTFSIDLADLPVGNYGIEVRCTDADGMRRRFYAAPNEFVRIVSPTSEAYIPTDGTENKMFDMTITFSLVGAAGDALARAEASAKAADDALEKTSEALDKAEALSGKANDALALANEAKATADGQAKTLSDTNAAMVEAEQARQTAEEGRVGAENARTDAEQARQTAERSRADAETARQTDEANRQDAEKLRQQNAASAVTAETAREQAETERKAAADKQAADYLTLYNSLEAKAAEVDRKITELTTTNSAASLVGCPARITVETERTTSVGSVLNIAPRQIEPSTANRSCIYKVYTGAALVDFRGNVQLPTEPGDSVIEVIPTLNSGAAEKVTIHAVALETVQDITGEAVTDENGEEITA